MGKLLSLLSLLDSVQVEGQVEGQEEVAHYLESIGTPIFLPMSPRAKCGSDGRFLSYLLVNPVGSWRDPELARGQNSLPERWRDPHR